MRIIDWSSDVCSSDLARITQPGVRLVEAAAGEPVEGVACELHLGLDRRRLEEAAAAGFHLGHGEQRRKLDFERRGEAFPAIGRDFAFHESPAAAANPVPPLWSTPVAGLYGQRAVVLSPSPAKRGEAALLARHWQIGRASCRERVCQYV